MCKSWILHCPGFTPNNLMILLLLHTTSKFSLMLLRLLVSSWVCRSSWSPSDARPMALRVVSSLLLGSSLVGSTTSYKMLLLLTLSTDYWSLIASITLCLSLLQSTSWLSLKRDLLFQLVQMDCECSEHLEDRILFSLHGPHSFCVSCSTFIRHTGDWVVAVAGKHP